MSIISSHSRLSIRVQTCRSLYLQERHYSDAVQTHGKLLPCIAERYNQTVRYSWLSQYQFDSITEVQDHATQWLWFYNIERPNKANGGFPPKRMLAAA